MTATAVELNWQANVRKALTVLLCLAMLAGATIQSAAAHGGGAPKLTRAAAGPYFVFVWTNPEPWQVGDTHTTIAVTLPGADGKETPVTGAQIQLTYTPVAAPDKAIQAVATEQTAGSVGFYEADAALPTAGEYGVTIAVSGPQGSGVASFTDQVQPGAGFNWSWILVGGLLLLAVVGFWWLSRRQRRLRTERTAAAAARSKV